MTQSELAQKAGVTQRLVSDFERGKVDIRVDTLCRLFIAMDLCLSGIDERLACENEEPLEWQKCRRQHISATLVITNNVPCDSPDKP